MLGDLPPYEADEIGVQAVISAVANELGRVEAKAQEVLAHFPPANAIDPYLSWWENFLSLPVAPEGVSEEVRRQTVSAALHKRDAGAGHSWVDAIDTALGGQPWSYSEGPDDYEITIEVPGEAGTYTAGQIAALARRITPSHLDVIPSSGDGFLVGISLIGIDAI